MCDVCVYMCVCICVRVCARALVDVCVCARALVDHLFLPSRHRDGVTHVKVRRYGIWMYV